MDLDEGLHGFAFSFNPGLPAIELACAFGALQVDLITSDDAETAVLALSVDSDVNLALEGVELERLSDLDELEFLRFGKLCSKAESRKKVNDCLLGNVWNVR
jgi:hypothetical protein